MVSIATLKEYRVEEQDLSSGDLTLEADSNESLEILARGIDSGADGDVIEEFIEESLVLAYQAHEGEEEVFPRDAVHDTKADVLGDLRERGFDLPTFPVPEGDTYTLSNPNSNGTAAVLYRELPAGGVSETDPGGLASRTSTFISNGHAEADLSVTAGPRNIIADVSENPGQARDFPFEEDVPQNREYELVALMTVLDDDNSGDTGASFDDWRLQAEQFEWPARDSAFILPSLAPYPNVENNVLPFVFPQTPTFEPGDSLDLEVGVSGNDDGTVRVDAAFVFTQRNVGGA